MPLISVSGENKIGLRQFDESLGYFYKETYPSTTFESEMRVLLNRVGYFYKETYPSTTFESEMRSKGRGRPMVWLVAMTMAVHWSITRIH